MSPYAEVWHFTRARLKQSYEDLDTAQLRWRPYEGAHSIGQILYHVAGAEQWFGSRLRGLNPAETEFDDRIDRSVRASFINEDPFPFGEEEMTLDQVQEALDHAFERVRPVMEQPTEQALTMMVETPLGPTVEGVGGLWRVAQHAAYHTGQIWTYRLDPRFPR